VADVRERLLEPDAIIIPAAGTQFISLIESPDIKSITSVTGWDDIKLDGFEALKDTVTVVFTKQYGFRLNTMPFKSIVPRISVADIDFYTDGPESLPAERRLVVKAQASGTIHAVMCYWEVYSDRERTHVMSTNPDDTRENFPRDMQWGQALQLVEDASQDEDRPIPLVVEEGDDLEILVRFSGDSAVMQFQVSKLSE
jgi:protein arginine N-methyltransferase 7